MLSVLAKDTTATGNILGKQLAAIVEGFGGLLVGIIVGLVFSWELTLVFICVMPLIIVGQIARMQADIPAVEDDADDAERQAQQEEQRLRALNAATLRTESGSSTDVAALAVSFKRSPGAECRHIVEEYISMIRTVAAFGLEKEALERYTVASEAVLELFH